LSVYLELKVSFVAKEQSRLTLRTVMSHFPSFLLMNALETSHFSRNLFIQNDSLISGTIPLEQPGVTLQ